MTSDWYEVVALGARYWFVGLGLILVWNALSWLIEDSRRRSKVLRNLPDAGYIGTLYVMEGESDALDQGDNLNIPAEGVLGSAMGCDVFLPHPSVSGRHMVFHLFPDGLHVRAYRDQVMIVDGDELPPGQQAILRHGAVVTLGTVVVQLRLFVGVTVKGGLTTDAPPEKKKTKRGRKAAPEGRRARTQSTDTPPPKKAPEQPPAPEEEPWDTGQWQVLPGWQDEDGDYDESVREGDWGSPYDEDDDQYGGDR